METYMQTTGVVFFTNSQDKLSVLNTESSRMLAAFKSRYITFASKVCKNVNPLATATAMFIRIVQGIG